MVGGAAAALPGLILAAVSLHLRAILGRPLYRDRSFTSLQGLVTILVVAAAALMPQSPDALGIEVLALGLYWLARVSPVIPLFTRLRPPDPAGPRSLLRSEWVVVLALVVAVRRGGRAVL